ncbi:MAG: hypothetical protein KIS96_14415 [Bauldia sp.]|nr:hypothetical protein [Bauldia sp.]
MTKTAPEGQVGAHTRGDPASAAAPEPVVDPFGLDPLDGSHDLGDADLLMEAAETLAAPRRARGRPPGAANRKNADMVRYLAQLGHRDPWVTLSLIQSADTRALAKALTRPRVDDEGNVRRDAEGNVMMTQPDYDAAVALQMRAAEAILPYHHARRPQQLELPPGAPRPVMVIGELNVAVAAAGGFMSAGVAPDEKANEINGDVVRQNDGLSHDAEDDCDIKDLVRNPTD